MTDTQNSGERQVPTWKEAVFAAALVFVITFGVSAWIFDWLASLVLAVWFAVFVGAIVMEGNSE